MRYTEKQSMKYSQKWYVLSAVIFLMIVALLVLLITKMDELDTIGIIVLSAMPVIMVGVFTFISLLELNIEIDNHQIKYKVNPLSSDWTSISKSDIVSYSIQNRTFSSVMKYQATHKVRWIGKNKRFVLLGKHFLVIQMTENRQLIMSTCQPDKIKAAMQGLMNQKQ